MYYFFDERQGMGRGTRYYLVGILVLYRYLCRNVVNDVHVDVLISRRNGLPILKHILVPGYPGTRGNQPNKQEVGLQKRTSVF
jgi:hypothetical protein